MEMICKLLGAMLSMFLDKLGELDIAGTILTAGGVPAYFTFLCLRKGSFYGFQRRV
jgi:hypothetical protein